MRKADFLGTNEMKFFTVIKTQQIFHPITQNTIKAFKFRAQASFSMLEKKHLLVYTI